MNRDEIRDRARDLGIKTADYRYAKNLEELSGAIRDIGFPCIVKPVMSSSGKGQTLIKMKLKLNMHGKKLKII